MGRIGMNDLISRQEWPKKRSQIERLTIAFTLIDSVWEEMTNGTVEDDMLQIAVYTQTDVNRIVWALNRRMSDERFN